MVNWDAIGAVGESIGAIAVCITLIFLTIQLRQANGSRRTVAYQTYLSARTEWMQSQLQPEINSIFHAVAFHPAGSTREDLQKFHVAMHLAMTYFASAYQLWKDGLLSDEEWQSNLSMLAEYKGIQGFQLWWPATCNFYNDDFVEEVDGADLQSTGLERFLENIQLHESGAGGQ